ncbi:TPA: hypothetical protein SLV86_001323 [Pseudomonas aeruginosa]|nr:hypothetical protein [Pseudomonas aeruginosa]HEJ2039569.1 hypothetical protein [Pseudomonas aeruginosa]
MAYYSGSAIDMAAVRSALVDACVAEGWAWNNDSRVLSKGGLFIQLSVITGPYLTALAGTGANSSGVTGPTPNAVRVGLAGTEAMLFPIAYRVFAFSDEIYLVLNYNVDCYQWLAFGKSGVSELPGTGMWVGASIGGSIRTDSPNIANISSAGSGSGGFNNNSGPLALFWGTNAADSAANNSFVHHDFDGYGWEAGGAAGYSGRLGVSPLAPLVSLLPNQWNSEAVLLPLRCYVSRPSSKASLAVDTVNARITRVDNYSPGQIIMLGSDRWIIFPWYRKNLSNRNAGYQVPHSGTFGWAIRYEGP